MKKNVLFSIALIFALFTLPACEEEGPFIDFQDTSVPIDTTDVQLAIIDTNFVATEIPDAQDKNVFIEEYSGVQCSNCPKGAEIVEEIKQEYPGRIVSTTLHAGGFAIPFPSNTFDFVIAETEALDGFFGLFGYPSAIIDRYQFASQNSIPVTVPNQWPSLVPERINIPTPVNVSLKTEYSEEAKIIIAQVEVVYTQAVNDATHMVSLFLTEDHIIDTQLMPDNSLNLEYEHEHVVRDMFTNWGGAMLESNENGYQQGATIIKTYSVNVDDTWNIDNLHIVACVHADGIDSKEVYQAQEISVQ